MRLASAATLVGASVAALLLGAAGAQTSRLAGSADMISQAGGATQVIRMDGGIAWMGVGPRLVAVDVSDPSAPQTLGRSELLPGLVVDLAIPSVEPNGAGPRTDVAWALVTGSAGAWVVSVDISRPWSPTYVGSVQVEGRPTHIAAVDDHVWLAMWTGSIVAVDAGDPAAPVVRSTTPVVQRQGAIEAVGAVDGHLVVATYANSETGGVILHVIDVSHPMGPATVGTLGRPGTESWYVRDMSVADGMVWLLGGSSELWAVDLTDPAFPMVVGRHQDEDLWLGFQLAVADGKAFLIGGDWGHNHVTVSVIDVSDPENMVTQDAGHHVASLDTDPSGGRAVRGGVLWMGVRDGRVLNVDASDPGSEPQEAGAVHNPGPVYEIALVGEHLLAAQYEAVAVIDVSEAAAPRQVAQTLVHRYPESISVDGDLAVVSTGGAMDVLGSSIETVGVGDPRNPEELAELRTRGWGGRSDVADGFVAICEAAFTETPGMVAFVDVADPRRPTRLADLDLADGCWDVELRDGIAYVLAPGLTGEGVFRLHVVDATDPENPAELGTVRLDNPAERWGAVSRLTLGDRHVYAVTTGTSDEPGRRVPPKLHVVQVTDPAAPTRVALVDLPSAAYSVAYDEGYVFLAMAGGVKIMDVRDPANPSDVITLPVSGVADDVVVANGLVYVAAGQGGIYIYAPQLPGWEPWEATPTATATTGPSPTPTRTRATSTRRTPTTYPLTLTPDLLTPTATPDPLPIRIYAPIAERSSP